MIARCQCNLHRSATMLNILQNQRWDVLKHLFRLFDFLQCNLHLTIIVLQPYGWSIKCQCIKFIQQNYYIITIYENPWWVQACEGIASSQESVSCLTFFPLNTEIRQTTKKDFCFSPIGKIVIAFSQFVSLLVGSF